MCIYNILLGIQVVQDRACQSWRNCLWRQLCMKCAWDRHLNNIHSHDCPKTEIAECGLRNSSPRSRLRSRSSNPAEGPVFVIGEKETDCTHVLSCEVQEKLAICAGSERCILNVARNHSQNVAREMPRLATLKSSEQGPMSTVSQLLGRTTKSMRLQIRALSLALLTLKGFLALWSLV